MYIVYHKTRYLSNRGVWLLWKSYFGKVGQNVFKRTNRCNVL